MTRLGSSSCLFFIPVLLAAAMTMLPSRAQAACNFAPVKQEIDSVLDKDAARGEKFRREVSTGSDSIAMMETLVPANIAKELDICRFEAAEYLTKRGFPPFH
jgi:hypothetical protein